MFCVVYRALTSDSDTQGGTSLLAGRLVARVRRLLSVPMTAATIFQSRTIAELAKKADELGATVPDGEYHC